MEPAIHYARHGHPVLARVSATIEGLADFFRDEWPTSAVTWLPDGHAPAPGTLFANPDLADTWDRLLTEAEAAEGREAQIEAARRAFYEGFVAEAIDDWIATACVMDAAGERRKGVLTGADMAGWQASYEDPLSVDYHGWTVWKAGMWSQGPTFLQSLRLLDGSGVADMDLSGADFVHRVTESMKLAFADREAYYGDPAHTDLPTDTLLSAAYADSRRGLITDRASREQRPGRIDGLDAWADAAIARAGATPEAGPGVGAGEPTMAHLTEKRGDTVHIDVIDRWGNSVSATPSGGWLQSSPVVPDLGMPLNSRAQMFWLDEGLPTSLAPGRRPRTTLSPSMAQAPDGTHLAFGTPGGDQQDQWQLIMFLRLVHGGMNLQEAIDAPLFHTGHFQASFYPRGTRPAHLMIEPAFGEAVIADLRARGHEVEVAEPWTVGRLTAASRSPAGHAEGRRDPPADAGLRHRPLRTARTGRVAAPQTPSPSGSGSP